MSSRRRHTKREKLESNAEVLKFRSAYGHTTDAELSDTFDLSLEGVRALAATYRLAKDKAFLAALDVSVVMPRWTDAEITKLKRLYPTHSGLEVAHKLSRSVKSVVSKAHQLKLKKTATRLVDMGRENQALRG